MIDPGPRPQLHVAVDLAPLIEDALSPASLRLLEAMRVLSATPAAVRLTAIAPRGRLPDLPDQRTALRANSGLEGLQAVRYTQIDLPRLARQAGAHVLLVGGSEAPVWPGVPCVTLDALAPDRRFGGWERLRHAAGRAGMQAAYRLTIEGPAGGAWGSDWFHAGGVVPEERGTPTGDFVLAHDLTARTLPLVMAAWTWVVGSGTDVHLLALTGSPHLSRLVGQHAESLGVRDSVDLAVDVDPWSVPTLYRRARALLISGGGSALVAARWGMASGLPIAAVDATGLSAVTGDAAYLTRRGDARALGAACLSLLVDEDLAADLVARGLRRFQELCPALTGEGLVDVLFNRATSGALRRQPPARWSGG